MLDVILTGRFYKDGSFKDLMVGVTNGIITDVKRNLTGARTLEIEGGIFPAGTDTHVHFRDPGETNKEDFVSGSTSAIFGGTTTVLDMPNNRTPIDNYNAFSDKLSSIRRRSHADYGLYSLFTGKNSTILHKDSAGVKVYLGGSTNAVGTEDITTQELSNLENMKVPVVFHAEKESCLESKKGTANNLREYNLLRPAECEKEAIGYLSGLQLGKKVATHISDYSSVENMPRNSFFREVTPHHLLLNDSEEIDSYGKVNPPLRERVTQERTLQAYLDGKFDVVSSDHAPHADSDKEEFYASAAGIIGVETRIPLLLALVQKGILNLDLFYRTAIRNPASIFGIKKGELEIGYYADFFSVNFSDMERLNEERLHSKNSRSPFHDKAVIFPKDVILRGEFALQGREIISDRMGQHLKELRSVESD